MTWHDFLKELRKKGYRDLHLTRNFSSFVAISKGKVVAMTDPWMKHCPLFNMLYPGKSCKDKNKTDTEDIKKTIKRAVEKKIEKFGSFTPRRSLERDDIAVPFGASEMMMYALRKSGIDAAVIVCDGAGSVISNSPTLIQGIGARMNGLFYTTPIPEVIKAIESKGGIVPFAEDATINQIKALESAAKKGYQRIAVTVNGFTDENISKIQYIEKKYSTTAICIMVCVTGVSRERSEEIANHADLVWSCASDNIRETVGKKAILQISRAIPVFVLTRKGLDFIANYSSKPEVIRRLDGSKQYLIAGNIKGQPLTMGTSSAHIAEAELPARSAKEPR